LQPEHTLLQRLSGFTAARYQNIGCLIMPAEYIVIH
jgi:hypothetical protein